MAFKWLPVVSQDACTGCGKCVEACDHECLELVWSFSTLKRPLDCGSEGACMSACPEDAILMAWVSTPGTSENGKWQTDAPPSKVKSGGWLRKALALGAGMRCIRQHDVDSVT